jgi:F-type H+-transporting ATPase subunit epsilon
MAEGSIDLTIVTPERAIVHEHVDELQIPGAGGYFGVLPGHAPLFSELKVGEVGYRRGNRWSYVALAWGFAEVLPSEVRILAETAERAQDIDVERAKRAKQRAEQRIAQGGTEIDYKRALESLARAVMRLGVVDKS